MRQKDALEREKQELEGERQELEGIEALQTERKKLEAERGKLADRKKRLAMAKPLTANAPSDAKKSGPKPNSEELMRQKDALEREKQELEGERQELEGIEALQTERKKLEAERGKLADNKKQLAMVKPLSLSTSLREVARDGRFIAYDNETVLDTGSGLMWAAKDNGKDVEDYGAGKYCKNYRGGGYTDWRMPTQAELARLFDSNKNIVTALIKITKCCPWPSDYGRKDISLSQTAISASARFWTPPTSFDSGCWRALPVRAETIE
ncbi:MAG: DUF1566 domain-containing protein [Deltaproteobacteria bacterium]|nr:DUF1566 domain-containing protein [Deltaproteobacteria bacterium]